MTSLRPIQMPTAFISPVRAKFDAETDRPADLEAFTCCHCFHAHLVTGRRLAKVLDTPCCGRPIRLVEAGEITVRARLLRGSDDMPELQRSLVRKLAVASLEEAVTLGLHLPQVKPLAAVSKSMGSQTVLYKTA